MKKKAAVIACAAAMMFGAVGYIPQNALPDRVLVSSSAQIPGMDNFYLKIVPQNNEVKLNEKAPFDVYIKSYKPLCMIQAEFIVDGGYIDDGRSEFIIEKESIDRLGFERSYYSGKAGEEDPCMDYMFVGFDNDDCYGDFGNWIRIGTLMVTPTSDNLKITTSDMRYGNGPSGKALADNRDHLNWTTIPAEVKVSKAVNKYPVVTTEVQGKQFRLSWTPVEGAEKYGLAVYSAGKWRVQDQISGNMTTYTSKKIHSGTYKAVLCAKINGEWDLSNINSRAFEISIK